MTQAAISAKVEVCDVSNVSRTQEPSKGPGRKQAKSTLVLSSFTMKSTHFSPKIEHVHYRVFRGLKRTLRSYLERHSLGASGLISKLVESHQDIVARMKDLSNGNREVVATFSNLTTGPRADHKQSEVESRFRTYSKSYLVSVFRNEVLLKLYLDYLALIFNGRSADELCWRWHFTCCSAFHTNECLAHWDALKELLHHEAIELGTKEFSG